VYQKPRPAAKSDSLFEKDQASIWSVERQHGDAD
jgi:hypothetical protein